LYLTEVHALLIDGVLAEAGNLVNGTTITRYGASAIDELEYFNVKLRGDKSIVGCDRGGWGRPLLLAVPIQAGMLRDLEHLRTVSHARVARGSLVRSQKGAFLPYISHAYALHTIPAAVKGSYIVVEVRV
jgi:hypothetical protein